MAHYSSTVSLLLVFHRAHRVHFNKDKNKMLICAYCGEQLAFNAAFSHASDIHEIPQYDERVFIPNYHQYVRLRTGPLEMDQITYFQYMHDTRERLIAVYNELSDRLTQQNPNEAPPMLDVSANQDGIVIHLYNPGKHLASHLCTFNDKVNLQETLVWTCWGQ